MFALRYKERYKWQSQWRSLPSSKNGDFVSRKGIPADVRDAYTRLYRDSSKTPLRITSYRGQANSSQGLGGTLQATLKVTKQRRTRERPSKTFTKEEALIILSACQRIAKLQKPLDRAKRWVPLLCAYTGARAGEMTQLRSEDVKKSGETYFAHLTPGAGTIKSGQARIVPLHDHLIELGFIEFVQARGPGPMFYKPAANNNGLDPLNPKRGPAVKARENLGQWVRKLGVTDPELSPSHAWRHTFLSKARQAGIEPTLRFGITGHETKSVGETYGQPEPEELAEAIKRFPRYEF